MKNIYQIICFTNNNKNTWKNICQTIYFTNQKKNTWKIFAHLITDNV